MENGEDEHEELDAAQDFRRQLQERSPRGHAHQTAADRLRWLDNNPELLARIGRLSLGPTRAGGLSPSEFKEMLAAVPLPSPHDEPFTHSIVRMLSVQIEEACRKLDIPLHSGVAYGANAALDISATKHGVPLTDSSVITLTTGFITFCSSISRMIALSLPHDAQGSTIKVSFNPDLVLAKIASSPDLRTYWAKMIGDYAVGSGPLSGNPQLVPYPASRTRGQILFSMERFSLAHEYAHHIGRHGCAATATVGCEGGGAEEELEADSFALTLERYIGMNDTPPNLFSASGAAAAVLLKCHECVKKARQILSTGEDVAHPDGIHPPVSDRITAFAVWDREIPEPHRQNITKIRQDLIALVDEMYRRLKPIYVRAHKDGVRPLPVPHGFDPPRALL